MINPNHTELMQICIEHLDDDEFSQMVVDYLCEYFRAPTAELMDALTEFWMKPPEHFKKWTASQIFAFALSSLNCDAVREELLKPKNDDN